MSQDPKSDLQKKPGRKKNTDAKMTLKFFFWDQPGTMGE